MDQKPDTKMQESTKETIGQVQSTQKKINTETSKLPTAQELEQTRLKSIYGDFIDLIVHSTTDQKTINFFGPIIDWKVLQENGYSEDYHEYFIQVSDKINYREFTKEQYERYMRMGTYPYVDSEEPMIVMGKKKSGTSNVLAYLPLDIYPYSILKSKAGIKTIHSLPMIELFREIWSQTTKTEFFEWFTNKDYEKKYTSKGKKNFKYSDYLIEFEKSGAKLETFKGAFYDIFSIRIPTLNLFFPFPSDYMLQPRNLKFIKRHHSNTYVILPEEYASMYFQFVYDFFVYFITKYKIIPSVTGEDNNEFYVEYEEREKTTVNDFERTFYYDFLNRRFDFVAVNTKHRFLFEISCHYGYRGPTKLYEGNVWYSKNVKQVADVENFNDIFEKELLSEKEDMKNKKSADKTKDEQIQKENENKILEYEKSTREYPKKNQEYLQKIQEYENKLKGSKKPPTLIQKPIQMKPPKLTKKTETEQYRSDDIESSEKFLQSLYSLLEKNPITLGIVFQFMYLKLKEKWFLVTTPKTTNESLKQREELGNLYKTQVDDDYHDFYYFELALAEAIWGFNPLEIPFPKITYTRKMLRFIVQEMVDFSAVSEIYKIYKKIADAL